MADKPLAFPWLNPKGPLESAAFSTMDPEVAEQCKQQLVQQHMLFKQQTAALASAVHRQVSLANETPVFIEENGSRTQVWNPLEAVKAEIAAAQAEGTKAPGTAATEAVAAAATTSTVSSPEAKNSRLLPEQEQVLLRFFGAQDRVDREEALLLARQANCSEQQVRQYLATLRSTLRSFIQRAQRNAAAKASNGAPAAPIQTPATEEGLETAASVQTQEEGDTDSMGQADRARQKAFGRLDTFLDENGGIKDPVKAGAFANFMRLMRQDSAEQPSFTVWQAQLQAIARTTRSLTLSKLAAAPDLVQTLGVMLKAAEQDQQISFMGQMLQALRKLPFPWAMLEGQDLLKRVLQLQKHRLPRIASAAAAMAQHWQELGGLGGVPFAIPAISPSARPSKTAMPPSAHLLGAMGMNPAAYSLQRPVDQAASASGAAIGQGMSLLQGHDQGMLLHANSRGSTRSNGAMDAGQTAGSQDFADRNGSGGFSQQSVRLGGGPKGVLGPAQAYTRGIVPRKRSNMVSAKPLSADEIVKANAKKRAAGGQIGGPAKIGRLDAATMAALGRRGPASAAGQLSSQGMGLMQGQGTGQAPGQGRGQLAGQSSAQTAGQGMRQATGQGHNRMPGPHGIGRGPGQVAGQSQGQGIPSSSHMMSSSGASPGLTPGRGPASPGGFPSLSPMGPGSLLSPTSGLGNLFNEETVARLQQPLSALPARPSPQQPHMLQPQQHHQQPPHHHYGQGGPYQGTHAQQPPAQTHQAGQGSTKRGRPSGGVHINQSLSQAAVARMAPTIQWAPLVNLVVSHLPDQVVPCAGEESTEAKYQARREAVSPEVRYIMAEDVSPDPYEPYEVEELQQPTQQPALLLPFVPVDAEERVRLSQKMADKGVTDPEHLSCAEPVDVVAHNPSPTELAPLDMIAPNDYEVPGGFSTTQLHDFGVNHPVHDLGASVPHMGQQQQTYYRTYDQQWSQQPDAFMMPSDTSGLSHGNDAFRAVQHFDLPVQNHSGQFWH